MQLRHQTPRQQTLLAALTLLALAPALTGCMVSSKDGANGDHNVAIQTPLGSMNVKTDPSAVQTKLGLPLYPGAVLKPMSKDDDKGHGTGTADVDMSFGSFHLRVLAMGFTSTDSPDKVADFYRKALAQYSDVIECRGKQPVGKPEKTGLGLSCKDDEHAHVNTNKANLKTDDDDTELKAGSASKQHIVSFKPSGTGTEFGLVSLELPHGDDDKDKTPN